MAWAGLIGLVTVLAFGPLIIPILQWLKLGQTVRDVGPESHLKKQGTPTMGGLLFLLPLPLIVMLFDRKSVTAWALALLVLGFGAVGFLDDFLKVAFKRPLGLRAREKLLIQVIIAVVFSWVAAHYGHANRDYFLPFHLGRLAPGVLFGPLSVLAILGAGNAVNITDGLDGLAAGAVAIATGFFAFYGVSQGNQSMTLVALALTGGLVGFLRFNMHPAKIFMGDTGSLALGAGLAGLSIVSGTTLLLPVVGIVFVIETLSVIIQVISFRLTGKRVFRMSPLHHHFELVGWPEERVVTVFWLISLVGALLAWW